MSKSYEDPDLSYLCDLTRERDELKERAMTDTDEIMELADEYAWQHDVNKIDPARAALRAAVEQVLAEYRKVEVLWKQEAIRAERLQTTLGGMENAVRIERERAERAEAEVARLRQELGQPLKAERERDELRAEVERLRGLLRDCREDVDYALINSYGAGRTVRIDRLARIDAALGNRHN